MYTRWHWNYITTTLFPFFFFLPFEIIKLYNPLFYLFICVFIYLLVFVHVDARFIERFGGAGWE